MADGREYGMQVVDGGRGSQMVRAGADQFRRHRRPTSEVSDFKGESFVPSDINQVTVGSISAAGMLTIVVVVIAGGG